MSIDDDINKWANPFRESVYITIPMVHDMFDEPIGDYWQLVLLKFRRTRVRRIKKCETSSALWNIVEKMEVEGLSNFDTLSISDKSKQALKLLVREMDITQGAIDKSLGLQIFSGCMKVKSLSLNKMDLVLNTIGVNWESFGKIMDSGSYVEMNDNIVNLIRRGGKQK